MKNNLQNQCAETPSKRYILIYDAPRTPGFWTFDGNRYHHFKIENHMFDYLESADTLPEGFKAHYTQPQELYAVLLEATAAFTGVKIVWCDSVDDCHTKEAERLLHDFLASDICPEKLRESAAHEPHHL